MAADPEVNKSSEESSTMLLKLSQKKRAASTSVDEDENSFEDNNNGESTGSSEAEEIRSKRTKTNNSGNKHPVYRGVRMRSWGKWVSEIREPKKKSRIWLGTYPTPEMAARAHDVAAMTIKGKSAFLNFPELASTLPRPASLSPRDIQAAAAEAASASAASLEREEKTSEFLDQQENSSNVSNSIAREWNSSSFDEKLIMDNDIFFNMPDFLNNMAEGLLVTPPWIINEDSCEYNFADVPLWSYSS